ncbi:MAG: hypothetical protein LC799_03775 [Actinobacteria bacterium]|nr:hypothetical protein [Actinomycetota bacterium]
MTDEFASVRDREVPGFVTEWRAGFEGGEDFTPLDYLNQDQGVTFTIAAQWLFCPNFVEYRGCVVVVKNGDDEGNLTDQNKANIDAWYEYFHGDIRSTEGKANLLHIADRFASIDVTPYEQYLPALARSVARCWEGLLAVRFPDRRFTTEVYGDSPSELDPNITFYTSTP